jgi:UDP-N-acetylglucosamine:LPS N-acetylglucosamine transferase
MTFATVKDVYRDEVGPARFRTVCDADLSSKARLARSAVSVLWTVVRHQPDVVISTGSAPGYFALAFGKLLGARTIWVDSMANADALSVSGQRAGRFADLWLTQWPDLAREGGPHYRGSVL